jgi:hypothetical protein
MTKGALETERPLFWRVEMAAANKSNRFALVGATPEATKSRKERVRELLGLMETSLAAKAAKATVADFIRLTQLERELEQDEQPGKVVVTWEESPEMHNVIM